MKDIELWIIDIDDTIAPHLTVRLGYDIAKKQLKNFELLKLSYTLAYGAVLHINKLYNDICNYFGVYKSNARLIKIFIEIAKKVDLSEYLYSRKEIERKMYAGVKEFISKLNGRKVMLSQSFSFKGGLVERYKEIFDAELVSNELFYDGGLRWSVKIKNKYNKRRHAEEFARKYKAKSVGIIMNDYEDLELLNMKNVNMVIMKRGPKKLRKKADFVVENSYLPLVSMV